MSEIEKTYTVKQTAALLGVHPDTIRSWARAGKIEFLLTPGGHRRFKASEVQRIWDKMHL